MTKTPDVKPGDMMDIEIDSYCHSQPIGNDADQPPFSMLVEFGRRKYTNVPGYMLGKILSLTEDDDGLADLARVQGEYEKALQAIEKDAHLHPQEKSERILDLATKKSIPVRFLSRANRTLRPFLSVEVKRTWTPVTAESRLDEERKYARDAQTDIAKAVAAAVAKAMAEAVKAK